MASIEQLMEWVKANDIRSLTASVEENADLAKSGTPMGVSLLQFAAYCRNEEAIILLKPSAEPIDFYSASSIGDLLRVKSCIESDASLLNGHGGDGFTGLGLACFFGHTTLVDYLLEQGADPNVAAANAVGVYPIHSACAVSNYAIAEKLLLAGADPKVKQQMDITPLHSAAHNGQLALVKLLLRYNADAQAITTNGQTAADMAEEAGFGEVAVVLRDLVSGDTR